MDGGGTAEGTKKQPQVDFQAGGDLGVFGKLKTLWNWNSGVKGPSGLNLWHKGRNASFIPGEDETLERSSPGQ